MVRLFNGAATSQDLSSWTIIGDTTDRTVPLPAWVSPPGSYLIVYLGNGDSDPDFSDSLATFFSGSTTWELAPAMGEVGLYNAQAGNR
jgi:hypothetical protein